ncbi:MAG TPA: SpoIIE family protein phosphatase [Herpetosiphonaceae bacterium]
MALWSKSLMARLIASFLLLALTMVSLVGFLAFRSARAALTDSLYQRLSAISALKEDELNRWIDDQRNAVLTIAADPDITAEFDRMLAADPQSPVFAEAYRRVGEHAAALAGNNPNFAELMVLSDQNGRVLFSTMPDHEGDFRGSDGYYALGRQQTYVQNVYLSPLTLRPAMTIATPVGAGARRGVLAIHLNLARMDAIVLNRDGLGASGETYLVDRLNEFVSAERIGRREFPRGVHTVGIDRAIQGQDGQDLYFNYAGQPVIGVYRWVEGRDLAMITELSQDEAFAPARELALTIALVGLALTIALVLAAFLLSRQIARPILALARAAERVADGDLSAEAPVETRDEIGKLAGSFNRMTGQLRSLYADLSRQVEELRQTQAALRGSEQKYRSIVEHAIEGIFQTTRDGAVISANPALARICGYDSPAEMTAAADLRPFYVQPGRRVELLSLVERQGAVLGVESQVYRKDGDIIWISENIRAVRDDDGALLYFEGSLEDVTARKQGEEQLEGRRRELEELVAASTAELRSANAELERLAGELGEKNRDLLQGLVLARDIQLGLLPTQQPWSMPNLLVHGVSLPSSAVGGDFYNYLANTDRAKAGIAVGDISGKGIGAAVMMALAAGAVEERARFISTPGPLLEALNLQLAPRLRANKMNAALLYLLLDTRHSRLQVANAGMIAPLLVRAGQVEIIEAYGVPLGSPLAGRYEQCEVPLQPGDLIVLVSDGVVEARNQSGEIYGFERLSELLVAVADAVHPAAITRAVLADVRSFVGDAEQHDDMTMVVIRPPVRAKEKQADGAPPPDPAAGRSEP